ncbi:MAG: hypothetical protein U5K32_13585 [Bacteroidales bacterium]|nr:hypothetical protein [Bacteroidales bacterium]
MKDLDKILQKLRDQVPSLTGRYELEERIMQRISRPEGFLTYFFAWTEVGWLRRSLAVASVFLLLAFGVQQLFIARRIGDLEKRMISFNTEKVLEYQREKVIANSVIFTDTEKRILADSLIVSTDDLMELVKSYRELQKKYEDLRQATKPAIRDINKQNL